MGYFTTKYEMPVCNHMDGVEKENIGYAQGITDSGVPFEAEFISADDCLTLAVIMPAIFDSAVMKKENSNLVGFSYDVESWDGSVLDFGMVDNGIEEDEALVHRYVDFLVECGIITFASNIMNGMVMNRVDILGHDLVKILITMTEGDRYWVYTDLQVQPFKNGKEHKVVNFKKKCGLNKNSIYERLTP
ncbi:MAG: hypothetical protein MR817_13430 [Lachnospiraceae bacterium]|nr:hypothetical protein [Lachnospiraceae bacterium]